MNKIIVGIIGCGYWGPNLIRNFVNNNNCSVKKICDLKQGRLDYINELYPGIETTKDFNEILSDESINAVVIATPVSTHKGLGILALNNGKDVFIEKPLTDNAESADELLEAAEKNNRILAVGHIFQFAPSVTAIKNFIDNQKLGKVYHISSQRINLGPPKTTVDVVWDLGPHDLSIIFYLFNEYPTRVEAFGDSCWWENLVDNAHIYLEFKSGKSAHIHLSWLSSNKSRVTKIFGEYGNIEYNEMLDDSEKVKFFDKGIDNRINAKDDESLKLQYGIGKIEKIELKKGEPLALEINEFINSVITRNEPINNGRIGKEVVKTLELASTSILEKRNEKLLYT